MWIRQEHGPEAPVEFDTASNALEMEDKLRWQFRLDDDIEGIYTDLGERNDTMTKIIDRYAGLRVMRVDPWECLVFFILAARTPIEKTHQRMESIAEAFATGPALSNGRYPFPRPEEVASDSGKSKLEQLDLGLMAKRTYIHQAAMQQRPDQKTRPKIGRTLDELASWQQQREAMEESGARVVSSRTASRDAITELRKIQGVGPKTANCVALFGLGYLNAFPVDTHVLETLKSLFLNQPHAGYASQFLFIEGLDKAHSR